MKQSQLHTQAYSAQQGQLTEVQTAIQTVAPIQTVPPVAHSACVPRASLAHHDANGASLTREQAKGVRSKDSWAEWGCAGTVELRRDFLVVPVPEVKVGICQNKRKITFQAVQPVTLQYTPICSAVSGRTLNVPQA